MEQAVLCLVAVLIGCGVYMILERTLLRVVIGISLLGNGTNLAILASGGLGPGGPPIVVDHGGAMVDPLPQALILTAIVIGFGVVALLLTLAFRTFQSTTSDDLGELHGRLYDE